MNKRFPWFEALLVCCALVAAPAFLHADWTQVRALVQQGEKAADEKKQEELFRKAYAMAQTSVAANPKVSNEYFWLAASAGRLALIASNSERITLSKVIKESAEKAIALDSRNGSAYMVLGAWHYYVADLSWIQKNAAKALYGGLPPASYQEAVTYLTKALQNGAENPAEIYYIRGCAYEELDQDAAALADFRQCLQVATGSPRDRKMQQKAREKLD